MSDGHTCDTRAHHGSDDKNPIYRPVTSSRVPGRGPGGGVRVVPPAGPRSPRSTPATTSDRNDGEQARTGAIPRLGSRVAVARSLMPRIVSIRLLCALTVLILSLAPGGAGGRT